MSFQGLMEGPGGAGIASLLGQTAQAGQGVANPMSQFNSLATQIAPSMIQAKAVEKFKKAEAAKLLSEMTRQAIKDENREKVARHFESNLDPIRGAMVRGDMATATQMEDWVRQHEVMGAGARSAEYIFPSPGSTYQSPGPKLGIGPVGTPVPMPQVQGGNPVPMPTGTDGVIQGQTVAQGPPAMSKDKSEFLNRLYANRGDVSKSLNELREFKGERVKQLVIENADKFEPIIQTISSMVSAGTPANTALVEAGLDPQAQAYAALQQGVKLAESTGLPEDLIMYLRLQLSDDYIDLDKLQTHAEKGDKWVREAQELEIKKQDSQTRKQTADNNSKILNTRINQIQQSTQTSAANEEKIRKETETIGQPDEEKAKERQERLIKEGQKAVNTFEKDRRAYEQKLSKEEGSVITNEAAVKTLKRQISEMDAKIEAEEAKLRNMGVDVPGGNKTTTKAKPVANPKTAELLKDLGESMKLLRETVKPYRKK